MNNKPYGVTIFCDDIRQEIGDKFTYIGIYTGQMNVASSSPALLSKLCAAVVLLVPARMAPKKIEIVLQREQNGEVIEIQRNEVAPQLEVRSDPNDDELYLQTILHSINSPFPLEGSCRILARGYVDGVEYRLGSLKIEMLNPA